VTSGDWRFDPPAEVLQSRLFATGGYLIVRGLFDEETLRDLRTEADRVRTEAERMLVAESDGAEGRRGPIDQALAATFIGGFTAASR
jgi:hypothetical protein